MPAMILIQVVTVDATSKFITIMKFIDVASPGIIKTTVDTIPHAI